MNHSTSHTCMRTRLSQYLATLDAVGLWIALISLRLILGWDFFESGLEKFNGDNWFADIQDQFPFPFNLVPPNISWQMAMWFELLGGVALVIGLGTRFFSVSLLVLSVVAIVSVHWPQAWQTWGELAQGYVFTDKGFGNFKYPVVLMGMLWTLLWMGPGRLSVDYWLRSRCASHSDATPTTLADSITHKPTV
jgi:putative oxidoreductase